jgi:hypothetical protein
MIYFTAFVLVLLELVRSLLSTSNSSHPQEELQPLAKEYKRIGLNDELEFYDIFKMPFGIQSKGFSTIL